MIKLRTKSGKRLKVAEDIPFIEICDADGNLGALVIQFNNGSEVKVVTPGDDSFDNYVRSFGSKITKYAELINDEMKRVESHEERKQKFRRKQ